MLLRTKQDKEGEKVLALASEYLAADPQWEWAPKPAQIWCEKGYALQDLGRMEEARAALKRCLELDPDLERAQKCLKDLGDA